MVVDVSDWSEVELNGALAFLAKTQVSPELGDLEDCPDWVRICALIYVSDLLKGDDDTPEIKAHIFQASTNYEKRAVAKILAARTDLWDRQDWLKGVDDKRLKDDFGRRDSVPDWVADAAIRNIQQQIFNLSTRQRRNPAERNPI